MTQAAMLGGWRQPMGGPYNFLAIAYSLGVPVTFVYLTFFDGYEYTWWNWIIAIPANMLLSGIWPIYWLILRPLFE